jgi:signal recognition particle subunit SRP54
VFDNLSQKLDRALKTLKGKGQITDINVAATIKEVRRALVDADVNYKVAKEVTDKIQQEALGQKVLAAVEPGQLMVKIVYDELTKLMGGEKKDVVIKGEPAVVLIAGLQGSGKTTFTGKLAALFKKQGRSVVVAACDVYRPAATEQLRVLAEQVGAEFYSEPDSKDPVQIAQNAVQHGRRLGRKVVIIDTAGRLAVDEAMMREVENIKRAVNPSETLFVVDAMTGQDAVNTAKTFNERLNFDGVVLTKLDGDSRGGAALSIRAVVEKPIKFISTGEKMDALDLFYPDRMAQRILGMGDVISLVERAQQAYDEDEAKRINAKIRKNTFNFDDFLSQLDQIRKMGNIKDLVGMIPGMGKALKDVEIDDNAFTPIESIIRSMTPAERANPDLLNPSRRKRIAIGSGRSPQEVNQMLKQFEQMRQMMRQMSKISGNPAALKQMQQQLQRSQQPGSGRR